MAELIETYASLPLGGVDAAVIAVAERLDVATVATLNQRDFAVVRPASRQCPDVDTRVSAMVACGAAMASS